MMFTTPRLTDCMGVPLTLPQIVRVPNASEDDATIPSGTLGMILRPSVVAWGGLT